MNGNRKKIISSLDIGINLASKKESEIFKWFLACLLFGKPIQQQVAKRTYFEFVKNGILSPQAILKAGWDRLVKVLDAGHYVRYDFSTADKMIEICEKLLKDYGSVTAIYDTTSDKKDLVRRLQEFKGIGPKTVEIFLRDMKAVWPKVR